MMKLRELRRRRALTQQELADLAGIHRVTVARIETGVDQPEAATVRKLARALGVEAADLGESAAAPPFGDDIDWSRIAEAIETSPDEQADVRRLLAEDTRLTPLLLQARDKAATFFGSSRCRLRHLVDPEYGDESLLLEVVISLDVPATIEALHRFDREWWVAAGRGVVGKLCIGPVWS